MMNFQYDSSAPLRGAPEELERRIGVAVTATFHHRGLDEDMVEIFTEYPIINTCTVGTTTPAAQWQLQAIARSQLIVDKLDALIAELTAHRQRMATHLSALQTAEEESERYTKEQLRSFAMLANEFDPALFDDGGTINRTLIVDHLSFTYGESDWLYDETHWIWELADELADLWQAGRDAHKEDWQDGEGGGDE